MEISRKTSGSSGKRQEKETTIAARILVKCNVYINIQSILRRVRE